MAVRKMKDTYFATKGYSTRAKMNRLKSYFGSLSPQLFLLKKYYTKSSIFKDLFAGIIVGIIAIPLSIAFATASGASPEAGLITAFGAGLIAAIFSGCRFQITGPAGAFIVTVSDTIINYGYGGMLAATFFAGIVLLIVGLLKLGKYIKYIARPIIIGATSGLAITISTTQVPDFFALRITDMPSEFLEKWAAYFHSFSTFGIATAIIGISSFVFLIIWKKLNIKFPGAIVAIILSAVAVLALRLDVPTIGSKFGSLSMKIKIALPFENMDFSLIKPIFLIAGLVAIESLMSALAADNMSGQKTNADAELISQGFANIVSSMLGGLPATGTIARTSANIKNGGVSPISSIIHAIVILLTGLILMPLAKYIPLTALAAVLFSVCLNMFEIKGIKKIFSSKFSDIALFIITFILTILFDLVCGIGAGIALSFVCFAVSAMIKHKKNKAIGLNILIDNENVIFDGSLNFFTVQKIFDLPLPKTDKIVLNLSKVSDYDMSGFEIFHEWKIYLEKNYKQLFSILPDKS